MFKIWARTLLDHKIVQSIIYENDQKFEISKLLDYAIEICAIMDIPTPMVLKLHKKNFEAFNIARFKKGDFVESVDFDVLILEYVVTAPKDPMQNN